MGAKQSKRSVDISGKEAEGAGEVAVAGAGGEGRLEPLADADALKPQLNGDLHVHESEKEKQHDSGTLENEKDANNEKVEKDTDKEKDTIHITNGESTEQKDAETIPIAEEAKKNKKEKVKKKWSLRSISFSRKDKPKQEKKQKDEEAKMNGEPENVPEEVAEGSSESNAIGEVEDTTESNDGKTPETPVTEPISNGSNTLESPKAVSAQETAAVTTTEETDEIKTNVNCQPEKLPVNGLSLEESKNEVPDLAQMEGIKPEENNAEITEPAPVTEIPVQKEVCFHQMPLIESTPPPLPANPPPSSVASFAATTMAPELTDASQPNTTETTISTPPLLDIKTELPKESTKSPTTAIATNNKELSTSKEQLTEDESTKITVDMNLMQVSGTQIATEKPIELLNKDEEIKAVASEPAADETEKTVVSASPELSTSRSAEDFPPPPPPLEEDMVMEETEVPITQEPTSRPDIDLINSNYPNGQTEVVANGDLEVATNNGNLETEHEIIKNKNVDKLGNSIEVECNGNAEDDAVAVNGEMQQLTENGKESEEASDVASPQEPIVVSDKKADLIPEIPVVPSELKNDTETSDVVAAN
ncbi:hypothetical protein ACJJTC_015689 [Scirpophaga incertulas]